MTEKEAIIRLDVTCCTGDIERDHRDGDDIIIEFLRANEFYDLADKYKKMSGDWWYA